MSKKESHKHENEQYKTKYDRKRAEKKKQEAKDKRDQFILRTVWAVICVVVIGGLCYLGGSAYMKGYNMSHKPYIAIGDHEISQLEYDFYFNSAYNSYLQSYGQFIEYLGLDLTLPLDEQPYNGDENMTWQDYFDQMTIDQLRQAYALKDDADVNNFEYDFESDYADFETTAAATAKQENMTYNQYIKSIFGQHANKDAVKKYLETSYRADAYYRHLLEENKPSDDEIEKYYKAHQNEYDKVSFHSFTFRDTANADAEDVDDDASTSDTDETADTTIEDDAEATNGPNEPYLPADYSSEAAQNANTMATRVAQGEEFKKLCAEYASDDMKENYNNEESDYSLTADVTSLSINPLFVEWLYDTDRKEGDITVIPDETGSTFYVLQFVAFSLDENYMSEIADTLSGKATSTYVEAIMESYEATNISSKIVYLIGKDEDASDETEEASDVSSEENENLLNTDIIQ